MGPLRTEAGRPFGIQHPSFVVSGFDILDGLSLSADVTDQLVLAPDVETVARHGRSFFPDPHRDDARLSAWRMAASTGSTSTRPFARGMARPCRARSRSSRPPGASLSSSVFGLESRLVMRAGPLPRACRHTCRRRWCSAWGAADDNGEQTLAPQPARGPLGVPQRHGLDDGVVLFDIVNRQLVELMLQQRSCKL